MGGFNLQELMSKAKSQYESLQKKMQETVVETSSGGGAITIKMDGRKQILNLRIDPEAAKSTRKCNPPLAACWAASVFRECNRPIFHHSAFGFDRGFSRQG